MNPASEHNWHLYAASDGARVCDPQHVEMARPHGCLGHPAIGEAAAGHRPALRCSRSCIRAFTLIEMILALAIAGTVLIAINSVLFGALHLRARTTEVTEQTLPMDRAVATLKQDLSCIMQPGTNGSNTIIGLMGTDATGTGLTQTPLLEIYTRAGPSVMTFRGAASKRLITGCSHQPIETDFWARILSAASPAMCCPPPSRPPSSNRCCFRMSSGCSSPFLTAPTGTTPGARRSRMFRWRSRAPYLLPGPNQADDGPSRSIPGPGYRLGEQHQYVPDDMTTGL